MRETQEMGVFQQPARHEVFHQEKLTMALDLADMEPFEICSIRPPTENNSLTFRLTRNCYWNRCAFCPVYKFGARYSKRKIEEVKEDIRKARLIDDLLHEEGILSLPYRGDYGRLQDLVTKIRTARWGAGRVDPAEEQEIPEDLDPRLVWFLSWFKDKPTLEDSLTHVFSWRMGGGTTCFLGDADSLVLKPAYLFQVMDEIKRCFPSLQRFTVYGRTKSAASVRTLEELRLYRSAGLDRVHFGLESGSDNVLKAVHKGVTKEEHIQGGIKTREAGLSCSVYVMPGLGGARWSEEHARETAEVITGISPDFVRLRTLQIFPQTPLAEAREKGEFVEATEEEVVREIRILVEEIRTETEIVSDSATNLLGIYGRLPRDRSSMLRTMDHYLQLDTRERLLFSLQSRLESFVGQYGGLTADISRALGPCLKGDRLDPSVLSDGELEEIITLIRSKLMP